MTHAPWTKEQAEQLADEYVRGLQAIFMSHVDFTSAKADFLAGLAKAHAEYAKMIEASPTVFHKPEPGISPKWQESGSARTGDTHQANLVNMRPIKEEGEGT